MNTLVTSILPDIFVFNRRQLSVLLTSLALALWAFSLTQAELVLDDWGIIHSLPVSYFIAMALLTIASGTLWLSRETHNFLLCLQLVFFIAMLWLTPLLLGTSLMQTRYEFGYYSNTKYIINFGYLDPATQWLHNWPGFSLFQTAFIAIPGLNDADTTLVWAPFIIQFIMILPLYLFFRNTTDRSNYSWGIIWIFYLFNHVGQFYFCNQAVTFFLMWIILTTLVNLSVKKFILSISWSIIIILLLTLLTMTHLLSSILLFFIMVIFYLTGKRYLLIFVILFAIFTLSWFIYITETYFYGAIPQFIDTFIRLDLMWQLGVNHATEMGSPGHQEVTYARVLLSALISFIGFVGLFLSYKLKSGKDKIIFCIAVGIFLLALLPISVYKGDLITRTFLFGLPVLSYFGFKLIHTKITALILIVLLVLMLPLSIIALHGNAAMDSISPSQLLYWHFIEDHTTHGRFTGGGMVITWSMKYMGFQIYDNGIIDIGNNSYLWRDSLFSRKWPPNQEHTYIAFSSYEEEAYKVGCGDKNFIPEICSWLNNSTDYNLFFYSGDVYTYVSQY